MSDEVGLRARQALHSSVTSRCSSCRCHRELAQQGRCQQPEDSPGAYQLSGHHSSQSADSSSSVFGRQRWQLVSVRHTRRSETAGPTADATWGSVSATCGIAGKVRSVVQQIQRAASGCGHQAGRARCRISIFEQCAAGIAKWSSRGIPQSAAAGETCIIP